MKKMLIAVLAVLLIGTSFVPVVFADPGNNPNKDKQAEKKAEQAEKKAEQAERKEEVKERIEERKQEREEIKEDFQIRMEERKEIKETSKEQLKNQRQVVLEYKLQLQELKLKLADLTEEEREQHKDELEALMLQVKQAHRAQLEIARAYRAEIKEILPGVRAGQELPSEEEVQDAAKVLGDI
jgi:hypothetical protein